MSYDRNAVSDYIDKWWNKRNTLYYPDFGDNDCTNFVSQCFAAGGIPTNEIWGSTFVISTEAWMNVDAFYKYMINQGICYESSDPRDAQIGDAIQFFNGTEWHHTAIVSGRDYSYGLDGILYAAHSNDRHYMPLAGADVSFRYLCVQY